MDGKNINMVKMNKYKVWVWNLLYTGKVFLWWKRKKQRFILCLYKVESKVIFKWGVLFISPTMYIIVENIMLIILNQNSLGVWFQ